MDEAAEILRSAVKRFEQAASSLRSKYSEDETVSKKLDLFILSCRYPCTATLNWRSVPIDHQGHYKIANTNFLAFALPDTIFISKVSVEARHWTFKHRMILIAALQLCVARHAHLHVHSHMPRHQQAPTLSTRTTTSLLFVEADLDLQYQNVYTTTKTAQGIETALGNPRAGFQPSIVGLHHQPQALPSQGWTGTKEVSSTWRVGNYMNIFYCATTTLLNDIKIIDMII